MSKVRTRGLRDLLAEAAAVDRLLRTMSDGRMGIQPVLTQAGATSLPMSWESASTEAWQISKELDLPDPPPQAEINREHGSSHDGEPPAVAVPWPSAGDGVLTRVQETFCSNCGCLDEPGVHTQRDCPRYERAATSRPEGK